MAGDDPQGLTTLRLEAVERYRLADDDRRRQLWRDSATILIGVVIALLAGQAFFPAPAVGPPTGSPTPLPSTISIGSFGPPPTTSLPPGATIGPILNPSLAIDATPTPIPVITMGPTPRPTPTPGPSNKASVKPSAKPSANPTTGPPPPTPEVTLPPPIAKFTWSVDAMLVTFENTSTGVIAGETTWLWDFRDGTTSTERNPGSHVYVTPGSYNVTLTMTTPAGTSTVSHGVTVPSTP